MAEITETNAPLEQDQLQVDAKAELAQQMQIALNNGIVPQEQVLDTNPPADNTPIETIPTDVPPAISFDSIREKFAYQTPEDAIKEIEEYRKFKANPVAEIEFENEASRKYFEAIKAGRIDEAVDMEIEQRELNRYTATEINKDNAAEIIKLGMKYKYKDLTPSEIDYKYKKQFSLPKEPIQLDTDDADEFQERHNEWKNQVSDIEMERIMEAKMIKPELEAKKSKLILPDIEAEVDEGYIQWKKEQDELPKLISEINEAYKSFVPKNIETKINFIDEPNKVVVDFQYEPTAEDFAKSVEIAKSPQAFYNFFLNQDGTPDRQKFLRAINFAINPEKVLTEAIKQSKNATLKSGMPDNNGGVVRQMVQPQQANELDAQMKARGISR